MNEDDIFRPFDELLKVSDRLYCVWQALRYGDDAMNDHHIKLASELREIWKIVENINENERIQDEYLELRISNCRKNLLQNKNNDYEE